MIILPSTPGLRRAEPELIDFGVIQRPSTGAAITRIDKPGMRYRCDFEWPAMTAETARLFIVRLHRALAEGLRVPFPLMGVSQGSPGNPVVDGGSAGGTSLPVRGATAGYLAKEGYWLNVVDSDGVHCLHQVAADVTLTGGTGTITVWPPLRVDLVDGNLVVLDAPKFEGLVTSLPPIPRPHTKVTSCAVSLEEAS